jgi:hypothetical protein
MLSVNGPEGSEPLTVWWRAGKFDPLAHLEALALAVRASAVSVEDVEQRDGAANNWTVVLRCLKCRCLFWVTLLLDEATDRLPDIVAPAHSCVGSEAVNF